ncbi:MAG TPA: L,D-transpeptidase family protein [Sphingomicrobium sp.]|jgi:L,D-transpeptidase YcbB|nr:L,D-transpeptidase family protein [Sphingomicrobium sp.]
MSYRLSLILAALTLAVPASAWDGAPIEPIDLPPSVEQGVDMIYIDDELAPPRFRGSATAQPASFDSWNGAAVDLFETVHPLYTELRRGLVRYQMRWGDLPQTSVPAGPALKVGAEGERVELLRERLGLAAGTRFDETVEKAVREYQEAHGLKVDGIVGAKMLESLNLGYAHYERILLINLERTRRLPLPDERKRYILVDVGAARLWMYENGKPVDSMKVIVGTRETATPMMAANLRFVSVNPYWNVPPELAQKLIAPRVMAEGLTYLFDRKYEVLSDWSDDAVAIDPQTVDWRAVAEGRKEIRLRRGPGPGNSMGDIKFMMPNDFGIYLHDTPDKALFAKDDRWISNGCVRVEDAQRLARWLFGYVPKGRTKDVEENVDLPQPVPVYMTYLTAGATAKGVQFRADPYGKDEALLARFASPPSTIAAR